MKSRALAQTQADLMRMEENQPGELSVNMYISVVEYIPPRTVRFTYQSTSLPSSPAPCQISSTSVARCLKLVGKFNGCAYA